MGITPHERQLFENRIAAVEARVSKLEEGAGNGGGEIPVTERPQDEPGGEHAASSNGAAPAPEEPPSE
jgi:hypothetical protein